MTAQVDGASFRDPSGRVLVERDRVVRWVSESYREHYDAFHDSKVSRQLRDEGRLIDFREIKEAPAGVYRALESDRIPFVSYPYEWPFSALKAAALLTLDIQVRLLENGFILKDATPFNVQFLGTRPVFIDLLSFEVRRECEPWMAYRQFCESFLAPLLLMAVDVRLGSLLQTHLDGIPLHLCSKLLPLSAKLRPLTYLHVVLHAKLGTSHGTSGGAATPKRPIGTASLVSIARQLRSIVESLEAKLPRSLWSSYYENHLNYSEEAFRHKHEVVESVLEATRPATVWDLGANTGVFSRLCSERGATVVAFDSDAACVERLYRELRDKRAEPILPLHVDLANPSAGVGWANRERKTLWERGPADLTLALGLIHHLRLTHNVPFDLQAELLARCGTRLVVEFVPADDEMTRKLARNKDSLLADYTEDAFLAAYGRYFRLEQSAQVRSSGRKLFLLRAE